MLKWQDDIPHAEYEPEEPLFILYTEKVKKQILRINNVHQAMIFLEQQGLPFTEISAENFLWHLSEDGVPLDVILSLTDKENKEFLKINDESSLCSFFKERGFSFTHKAADDFLRYSRSNYFRRSEIITIRLHVKAAFHGSEVLVKSVWDPSRYDRYPETCTVSADFIEFHPNFVGFYVRRFEGSKELKHLIFPEGVTKVPNGICYECTSLESVSLPSTVTFIGHLAFYNCVHLRRINIPQNLNKIGYGAFKNCIKLQTEGMPESIEEKRKREAEYIMGLKKAAQKDAHLKIQQLMESRQDDVLSVLKDLTTAMNIFFMIEFRELLHQDSDYFFSARELQAPDMESVQEIPEKEFESEVYHFFEDSITEFSPYPNKIIYSFSAKRIGPYIITIILDALRSINAQLFRGDIPVINKSSLYAFLTIRSGNRWYLIWGEYDH